MVRPVLSVIFSWTLIAIITQNGWAQDRLTVFVSIVPQTYFVRQIGIGLVDVQVMVPPGSSPATYEPKPRQMAGLSKARIYFAIGVPFENAWLKRIAAANPQMQVVHTERGIKKIPMAAHEHPIEGEHPEHGILDPHIWLSPPLVKMQAHAIPSTPSIRFCAVQCAPVAATAMPTNSIIRMMGTNTLRASSNCSAKLSRPRPVLPSVNSIMRRAASRNARKIAISEQTAANSPTTPCTTTAMMRKADASISHGTASISRNGPYETVGRRAGRMETATALDIAAILLRPVSTNR